MKSVIFILSSLLELITMLLQKYKSNQIEKKYEEAINHTSDTWVSGFGVRKSDKDTPTETNTNK